MTVSNMCYILQNKNSVLVTYCVTEYMVSYFLCNINTELVTSKNYVKKQNLFQIKNKLILQIKNKLIEIKL